MTYQSKSIVVISWDGETEPLSHILLDTVSSFDIFLIDYSGKDNLSKVINFIPTYYLSKKSECKGDLINNVSQYLIQHSIIDFKYIGFLDDDIFISISDLNKLLFIATLENLDAFQSSLTHDSYFHHRQFIHKPGCIVQETPWVEIMAPFYSNEIFASAGPYLNKSISGTGTDVYLIPTIQQILGKTKTAVIHAVQMKHCRPIRTGNRIFSNQKSCLQEIHEMQGFCKTLFFEFYATHKSQTNRLFIKKVLNRNYSNGIPLRYKLARVIPMIKNLYKLVVDASYR